MNRYLARELLDLVETVNSPEKSLVVKLAYLKMIKERQLKRNKKVVDKRK